MHRGAHEHLTAQKAGLKRTNARRQQGGQKPPGRESIRLAGGVGCFFVWWHRLCVTHFCSTSLSGRRPSLSSMYALTNLHTARRGARRGDS